jgi:hypothetical protein
MSVLNFILRGEQVFKLKPGGKSILLWGINLKLGDSSQYPIRKQIRTASGSDRPNAQHPLDIRCSTSG